VELPLQRKICLPSSETPQHITPEIALLPAWRRGKSCLVENIAARILRPIEFKGHSWIYIRAVRVVSSFSNQLRSAECELFWQFNCGGGYSDVEFQIVLSQICQCYIEGIACGIVDDAHAAL
jgi:hypothetical protein